MDRRRAELEAGGGTRPTLHVSADLEAWCHEAALRFTALVRAAVQAHGSAAVALAGGETPRRLYQHLSTPPERDRLPWDKVQIFWSDDRAVPPDNTRSNYRMAHEVLLAHVPVRPDWVHRMPADDPDLDGAARSYARLLSARARIARGGWPRLDVVLLGLGSDGHTASLFPGDPALEEQEWAVAPVKTAYSGTRRLTLTLPVLNAAARVIFLVAGTGKAKAVRRVIVEGDPLLPATRVRPVAGELIWLLDADAASESR